ncbi:MAG: hypothetical protein JWM16_5868 [Verrucomicrobiales bacterium]|nr:hypothetical protein [Verrucomicrobiales bacterium]
MKFLPLQPSTNMTSQQQRFVELRAQGASYRTIAFELSVSERTLFYWRDKLES